MNTSLLSPKYQIVIPREIRRKLELKPGQRFQFRIEDGHIEIEPVLSGAALIGYLKGPEPLDFEREGDRSV
jgi:AbrB family looped-hinge helix DNA binding protein